MTVLKKSQIVVDTSKQVSGGIEIQSPYKATKGDFSRKNSYNDDLISPLKNGR